MNHVQRRTVTAEFSHGNHRKLRSTFTQKGHPSNTANVVLLVVMQPTEQPRGSTRVSISFSDLQPAERHFLSDSAVLRRGSPLPGLTETNAPRECSGRCWIKYCSSALKNTFVQFYSLIAHPGRDEARCLDGILGELVSLQLMLECRALHGRLLGVRFVFLFVFRGVCLTLVEPSLP